MCDLASSMRTYLRFMNFLGVPYSRALLIFRAYHVREFAELTLLDVVPTNKMLCYFRMIPPAPFSALWALQLLAGIDIIGALVV